MRGSWVHICSGALVLISTFCEVAGDVYVTAEDRRVAQESNEAASVYCEGGFRGELDRKEGRDSLEAGVGEDNIVRKALENSKSWSDVGPEFVKLLTPAWIIQRAVPLLMAALVLLMWLCSCCCACPRVCHGHCCGALDDFWYPCIKCCRLSGARYEDHLRLKGLTVCVVFLLLICIVVCGLFSMIGLQSSRDGVGNMFCTAATLLDGAIGGVPGDKAFIGMIPLLEEIDAMESKLDTNSSMLTELNSILDQTAEIDSALMLATQTVALLGRMLSEARNVRPVTENGVSLLHICRFCESVQPSLNEAQTQLESGVGTLLADARSEVDSQLTLDKRQELQRNLRAATKPVLDMKHSIRESLFLVVDPDRHDKIEEYMEVEVVGVVFAVLVLGILLFACSCSTCFFFLCQRERDTNDNPYRKRVHRCACCTWCLGFLFAALAFFVGGGLVALVVPLSGACLVLDDLNGQTLFDIIPGNLSFSNEGDSAIMTKDVINKCVNPTDASAAVNSNILDILYLRENETKVTMREKVVEQMKDKLTSKFALIEEKLASVSSPNLTINPSVTQLRTVLRDTPMSAMIIADGDVMVTMPEYQPLLLDTRGEAGVGIALATSAACDNFTLATNEAYGDFSGQTVPGIVSLIGALQTLGDIIPDASCAKKVTCRADATAVGALLSQACEAANKVVDLKRELLTARTYRCDMFELPNGQVCDIADMIPLGGDGKWQHDCLHPDGTMMVKDVKCTLDEFTEYVKKFDNRILKAFLRLDGTVNLIKDKINVQIRQLMEVHITQPIDRLADGVTCGFIASHYRGLVDGLCYQGVYGLRVIGWCYVACGILAVLLIAVIHAVWRIAVDEHKLWETEAGRDVVTL